MFQGMEYVYAVYKEKSFTAAAAKLYVSQPCLSAAIKKIDQAASKGLLHKNTAARRKSALAKKANGWSVSWIKCPANDHHSQGIFMFLFSENQHTFAAFKKCGNCVGFFCFSVFVCVVSVFLCPIFSFFLLFLLFFLVFICFFYWHMWFFLVQ